MNGWHRYRREDGGRWPRLDEGPARRRRKRSTGTLEPREGGETVKVAQFDSEPLARMWAELLRNNGVPCYIKGTGGWSSAIPVELYQHNLYVRAEDEARATALLGLVNLVDEGDALLHKPRRRYRRRRR